MTSLFLLALVAGAAAVKYTCGAFSGIVNSTDYTFDGRAQVFDNATGSFFVVTNGILKKNGTASTKSVVAHVHAKACNDGYAGGHFLKNISITVALLSNELWASPGADSNPAKQTSVWSGSGSLLGFSISDRTDIKAVIVHEYADDKGTAPSPKRVCCDLELDATPTIAPFCPSALNSPGPSSTTPCGDGCRYTCTGPSTYASCTLTFSTSQWNVQCGTTAPIGSTTNPPGGQTTSQQQPTMQPTVTAPTTGTPAPTAGGTVGSFADSSAATAAVGESSAPITMSSTIFSTSLEATAAIMTSAVPQSPTDNSALIGGIVGAGIVALLLVCGLTAFFVARNRRQTKEQAYDGSRSESAPSPSNYGRIPAVSSNYGESAIVVPHRDHYDSLTVDEI